jgi:hypothetical protein
LPIIEGLASTITVGGQALSKNFRFRRLRYVQRAGDGDGVDLTVRARRAERIE